MPTLNNNLLSDFSSIDLDAAALRQRFERLRLRQARLSGMREAAIAQEVAITEKVAQAKGRLALTEEVQAVIDGLQRRAHERSVGVFEKLLSAILSDVLPGTGQVKLALGTERGLPSLDVQIEKNGSLEDALDASGGAVTNVLVTGLRFAALSRTANRRFMVLDEPDCWLKPERVASFIRVIAQVAEKAQTQTILISHHEPALFEGLVNIVRIVRGEAGPEAQTVEPHVSTWTDDETPGIRSIRLINFRAHKDTTVQLFPGVTALVGDNDLGKSTAAIGALRAVAYGESDDTAIRHGETESRIVLTLEKGRRIEWVRRLKGSPRVTYLLFERGLKVHEGRPIARGQVPEWISEVLGVNKVDELDIQLGSQKEPVFLLNQGPSTRAQLLSVGRESGRLHQLIESYGALCRRDREQVRDGEAELIRLRYRISSSSVLSTMNPALERMDQVGRDLQNHDAKTAQLGRLLERVTSISKRQGLFEKLSEILSAVPAGLPALQPTSALARLIAGLTANSRAAQISPNFIPVSAPRLHELHRLREVGARIARLTSRAQLKVSLPTIKAIPGLFDTEAVAKVGALIAARHEACIHAQTVLQVAATETLNAHRELETLAASLGGICPLCEGHLPERLGGKLQNLGEVA